MWKEEDNQLKARFTFKSFTEAFAFMTEVAFLAEEHRHHPNWSNVYNKVDIHLCTHDAGDIVTEKDRQLASSIDEVFAKYNR